MTHLPLSVGWILSNLPCQLLGDLYPFSNNTFQGITQDSRKAKPGFLFVAIPGTQAHGKVYISNAVHLGATGILSDLETCSEEAIHYPHLPFIAVPDVRFALAKLASLIYSERPSFIAAVTGTNGKSSVVGFARQLWGMLDKRAASLGTLGVDWTHCSQHPKEVLGELPALTTLDPLSLHTCLQTIRQSADIDYLAIEAASHGLEQKRLEGLQFQAAAFTNFSRDHLDYHGTLDAYFEAKARLFTDLVAPQGKSILWADIDRFESLVSKTTSEIWSYGYQGEHLRLLERTPTPEGQHLKLSLWGSPFSVFFPLLGEFQALNALAALGIVVASGFAWEQVAPLLERLKGIPGRLELADTSPTGASIYVDYAHTPDALQTVLKALRPHTKRKLGVVFGCGGDRDQGKRQEMGSIAEALADWVIVTDDNPRYENPAKIRREVLENCSKAKEIPDRREAIAQAIQGASPGDLILIAGKGHEHYQQVGSVYHLFQDTDVVKSLLK
ncbi:MAG: UDP-N-acetylmuramoyl-L-alanyl-D-glutamate--2,6-diaminopimelate ligase [Alphaproteobacteria bacterium]